MHIKNLVFSTCSLSLHPLAFQPLASPNLQRRKDKEICFRLSYKGET